MTTPHALPSGTALTFALVGNPNCGKTTVFNCLTGMRQKVGNYPGVTVEKKVGQFFSLHGKPMQLVDLPGAYSLTPRSPDEEITRDVLLGARADTRRPDRVVCVVDASNLERNLFLVTQILDLGLPTIVALNMTDVAEDKGLTVDAEALSLELGVPVVSCRAHQKAGITELRQAMGREILPAAVRKWKLPDMLESALLRVQSCLVNQHEIDPSVSFVKALDLLGSPSDQRAGTCARCESFLKTADDQLAKEERSPHEAIVSARYDYAQGVCERVVRSGPGGRQDLSDRLDAVFTHPVWGWVAFLFTMGLMFFSIFTVATYPMDWVDKSFGSLADWVRAVMPPGDLRGLLADGVIAGVGGVLVFLPQILILFFFIGLLEDTGYMARAAFIMDRVMSRVGLHGKSFIPLLSSYACAIPGIMATRTIENPKDRLVTILVAPLMSCSARLPVYTLMIAALLPNETVPALQKAGLMMALYAVGTVGAFFFAGLFKKTLMRGETPVFIMELPPYRLPSLGAVVMQMLNRSKLFVRRAGTVILGLSILLWFMTAYPKSGSDSSTVQLEQSIAGKLGKIIEPVVKPLGFDWKIGIGLIGSFAAREVFVSTMSIVYNVEDDSDVTVPLRDNMLKEKWPDGSPVYTPLVCVSLLLFYVIALQCMATIAVVRRETNSWKWPLFQLGYLTGTAYLASLIVFQTGKFLGF
ncbi:MAG: ferrous iron transport protein B [Verrucomicrobia bacterium]|nr:ferrous iron transport protein B [Verrucomicrobiota bacterium]